MTARTFTDQKIRELASAIRGRYHRLGDVCEAADAIEYLHREVEELRAKVRAVLEADIHLLDDDRQLAVRQDSVAVAFNIGANAAFRVVHTAAGDPAWDEEAQ